VSQLGFEGGHRLDDATLMRLANASAEREQAGSGVRGTGAEAPEKVESRK